ncbi:ATP-binding cassette domain-containing protein, partial [Pseudomonas syringae]
MLNVSHLNVYYGDSHVLRDLSLELAAGESLAVMGRNGMGKTT